MTHQIYTVKTHPVVAIDMDNTIWTEDFPEVGTPFPDAIDTINFMNRKGYQIIIWTSRGGENLQKCIEELHRLGLDKDIIFNEHASYFTERYPVQSPKVAASIYLDDKSYGAPDYSKYWKTLRAQFLGW